jgi:hypothetical protein
MQGSELEDLSPPPFAKTCSSRRISDSNRAFLHDSLIRSRTDRTKAYLQKHEKLTISQSNPYKQNFDILMKFLVIYSVTSSLYFLALSKETNLTYNFDLVVWCLFLIDFISQFFSEYTDKKNRKVRNLKVILRNYAKTRLFFDLGSLIPLHFWGHYNVEYFLRLLRISRMRHFFDLVKILKISEVLAGWVYRKETRNFKNFRMRVIHLWEILKQIIIMFYMTFFLACIWFYYVDFIIRKKQESNSFYSNFGMEHEDEYTNFMKTWYFIFTTLVTVGYGDFYATNKYEMGFAILLLLAGPTWFAFMMGKSITIINKLQDLSGRNNKLINLQLWMFSIEEKIHAVPNQLKGKIFAHFSNYWKYDRLKSLQNSSDETRVDFENIPDELFKQLPVKIKEEILEYLFSDMFWRYCHFFNFLDEEKFSLLHFMKPFFFACHEIVIYSESKVNELYFILNGQVEVGIFTHKGFQTIGVLNKHLVLGDFYVIKDVESPAVFRALNFIRGYLVPAFAFNELVNQKGLEVLKYLEKIQDNYESLGELVQELHKDDVVTTEERIVENLNRKRLFPLFKKIPRPEFFKSYLNSCPCEMKCKVRVAVKDIKTKIKDTDVMRRKLIRQVKEKLVENILKRTEGEFK